MSFEDPLIFRRQNSRRESIDDAHEQITTRL